MVAGKELCADGIGVGMPLDSASQQGSGRAFTLIELILVVALIGLLIALLLSALSNARMAARIARSTTQLRSHGQVFSMYLNDWDDTYPFFADPDATLTVLRCRERGVSLEILYFYASNTWNYALADSYYRGNFDDESFYPPGMSEGLSMGIVGGPTPYSYGCSFVAHPEYWRPESREGSKQRGPNRGGSVLFPAQKALLVSDWPLSREFEEYIPPRESISAATQLCFVDGSAESRRVSALLPGYESGDGVFQGAVHLVDYPFALHTLGGVRGRDR